MGSQGRDDEPSVACPRLSYGFRPVRPRPVPPLLDPPMIAQPQFPNAVSSKPAPELSSPQSKTSPANTDASDDNLAPAPSTMRTSPPRPALELPMPRHGAAKATAQAGLPEAAPAPSNSTTEAATDPAGDAALQRNRSEPGCASPT